MLELGLSDEKEITQQSWRRKGKVLKEEERRGEGIKER